MAQDAAEAAGLDKVIFLPAGAPPLKATQPQVPPSQRLEMVNLAISDNPLFTSSDIDLASEGLSYSIDAVRQLQKLHANDELFWIMGTDQLAQLEKWKNIDTLVQLLEFIIVGRLGVDLKGTRTPPKARLIHAPTHTMAISSSEIRLRLRKKQSVNYFLHPKVLSYIKAENLYIDDSL